MPHFPNEPSAAAESPDRVRSLSGESRHMMDLPDEILLEVLKMVSPEDLSSVKQVNHRLRALVLNYTVRLDYTAFHKDAAILNPAGFANLILRCPRLRALSLIRPADSSGHPDCFMESFLKPAKKRTRFAKSLAKFCPAIRMFEVSSLNALRMLRDYVRFLKNQSVVTEIRLYSCKSRPVHSLMLSIGQFCPLLRVFKFLRRASAQSLPADDTSFCQLWDSLSHKLHGFSTNVTDRAIIQPSLSRLVHLRRLVIWFLAADEIDVLTRHCPQLTSLILMSADPAGFKFLTRLPHLMDLTFCLPRDEYTDMSVFEMEFDAVFREMGPRLRRISFDFRKCSSAVCLKNLTRCSHLTDLKLRGLADCDKNPLFNMMQEMKSLRSLTWKDEDEAAFTDVITQKSIQKLFKNCPRLNKFVVNDTQYARRKSPATTLICELAGE